jgi:transposase
MKIIYKKDVINKLRKTNISMKEISKIFNCCVKTIYNWINKKEQNNKIGRPNKISENMGKEIVKYINSKTVVTQKQIKKFIFEKFKIKVHQSTISRFLKKMKISYKKITKIYSEKKIKDEDWLKEFKETIKNNNILAMDECSFHLNSHLNYGYSKIGKRAYYSQPGTKGKRFSLILCISKSGKIINWRLSSENTNSEIVKNFLQKINNKNTVLLDNASYHKSKIVKEFSKCKLYYLPPYSPMLNPTELCFSFIKHYVKKHEVKDFNKLYTIIKKCFKLLKGEKISNFFKHCLKL